MPFYQYFCESCHQEFELFQRITDDPVKICEQCGKKDVRRLLFAPAVHFKGSGFYCTEYRDSAYLDAAKCEIRTDTPNAAPKDKSKQVIEKPVTSSPVVGKSEEKPSKESVKVPVKSGTVG